MTLKLTADQVHQKQVNYIGVKNIPNPWWGLTYGNDCVAFQLYTMGVRTRTDYSGPHIGISAFRLTYGWHEVEIDDLRFGDLVLEEWPDRDKDGRPKPFTGIPNHMERFVTRNTGAKTITTLAANTGPRPGINAPRGAWEKTRVITDSRNYVIGLRPPYAGASVSSPYGTKPPTGLSRKQVKVVAAFLNSRLGGLDTGAAKDGVPGGIYWDLVQKWGRSQGIYGNTYKIDGIPGPRTRQVEAVAYKAATKK